MYPDLQRGQLKKVKCSCSIVISHYKKKQYSLPMISCLQKQLKTRLPSNIRQTACECIYSVTYGKSMNIHSMAVALYNPALIWCMEFPVVMFSRHPSTQCASWSNITRVCNMRLSYQSWLTCYLLLNLAVLPPEFDSFKIAFPVGVFYLLRGVLCDFDYWNTSWTWPVNTFRS